MSMPREPYRAADGYIRATGQRMADTEPRVTEQWRTSDERWATIVDLTAPDETGRRGAPVAVALGVFLTLWLATGTTFVLTGNKVALAACLGCLVAIGMIVGAS